MWRRLSTTPWRTAGALGLVGLAIVVMALAPLHPVRVERSAGLSTEFVPIVIAVPYPAGTTAIGYLPPATWAIPPPAGGLVWPGSPASNLGTGAVIIDEHATANLGGFWGALGGEAGFSVPFVCGGACAGSAGVDFKWTGSYHTQIIVNCQIPGGAAGQAQAAVSLYGQVWSGTQLIAQTIVTPVDQFSTTFPTNNVINGLLPSPVHVAVPGGLVPGTAYFFVGFAWTEASANCNTATAGVNAYGEADVGNFFAVTMPQVAIV